MTGKKLAGVIMIFIGTLGLIITFYVTFPLLFVWGFCGSAPNGCDGRNVTIFKLLSVALVFCIFFIFCIISGGKNVLK